MEVIIILFVSVLWSLVGVLVKSSSLMMNSSVITFCRFFFGIIFLGLLMMFKNRKIRLCWKSKWIWLGAAGKCCNYICENLALTIGHSYGNILIVPFQTIFLILASVLFFKERLGFKSLTAAALSLIGGFLISWNGLPLSVLFQSNAVTTLLFLLSAVGTSFHVLSQKLLIDTLDSGNMNFSMFLWCSLATALPLPFNFKFTGSFNIWSLLALVCLGFITGISFYLYADALGKVPFLFAVIISNSSVLFALLWSHLFYKEPITMYIISGTVIFLIGIIMLNIPKGVSLRRIISLKP